MEQSKGIIFAVHIIPQHAVREEGAMAQSQRFHVGDRVRILRKQGDLPEGANGTIIRIFDAADCSDIQIDGGQGAWLVADSDLELIERESETGQE
jgi:hypothetical protein